MKMIDQDNLPIRMPTRSGLRIPHWVPAPLRWRLVWWSQHFRVEFENMTRPLVELGGVKLKVTRELSDNIRAAIFDRYYESEGLRTLQAKLESSDRVMEIGAGIGLISAFCALRYGSDRVIAYKANPCLEPVIRQTYQLNGIAPSLEMCTVGPREGEMQFYVAKDFWMSSAANCHRGSVPIKVKVKSLNPEIRRFNPTFLVMDIEGGEYELFKQIDLYNIRKMSLELHTDVLGEERIIEIRAIIRAAGFRADPALSFRMPGVKEILFVERTLD